MYFILLSRVVVVCSGLVGFYRCSRVSLARLSVYMISIGIAMKLCDELCNFESSDDYFIIVSQRRPQVVEIYFFFFKQKTAYEMRISDWSSDVCSSDLRHRGTGSASSSTLAGKPSSSCGCCCCTIPHRRARPGCTDGHRRRPSRSAAATDGGDARTGSPGDAGPGPPRGRYWIASGLSTPLARRSEEHTSELQSLMRISYAVFCLKKKNKNNNQRIFLDNTSRKRKQ